jgi:predicted methyltransferase
MNRHLRPFLVVLLLVMFAIPPALRAQGMKGEDVKLRAKIANPARTPRYAPRDKWRHPYEVLRFFGLKDSMTVVEIWPGRRGWWMEILIPYLHNSGRYIAVQNRNPKKRFHAKPGVEMVVSNFTSVVDLGPPGSADMVLTFRNLHNWMKRGVVDNAFAAFLKVLKPGGVLGMVDHRSRTGAPQDPLAKNGYVREDYAIALAEKAGFKFVGKSEVNANPLDSTDHPAGVWTLAPSFRLKDQDRAKYAAIGESDRFVLKFVKP